MTAVDGDAETRIAFATSDKCGPSNRAAVQSKLDGEGVIVAACRSTHKCFLHGGGSYRKVAGISSACNVNALAVEGYAAREIVLASSNNVTENQGSGRSDLGHKHIEADRAPRVARDSCGIRSARNERVPVGVDSYSGSLIRGATTEVGGVTHRWINYKIAIAIIPTKSEGDFVVAIGDKAHINAAAEAMVLLISNWFVQLNRTCWR